MCICLIFLHCVFSYESSNCLPERMHSYIGCICLPFLRCVFSNVALKRLNKRKQNHIGCICLTFLRCVFFNVSSNYLPEKMHTHIGCICLTFLHYEFSYVFSSPLPEKMHTHIGCIYSTFLHHLLLWLSLFNYYCLETFCQDFVPFLPCDKSCPLPCFLQTKKVVQISIQLRGQKLKVKVIFMITYYVSRERGECWQLQI